MARRSPTLATALEDWLTVRSAGRGLSPNTTRAYRADIAVVRALAALQRAGRSPATRARIHGTLAGLCAYLVHQGQLSIDPLVAAGLERPKLPKSLPRYVERDSEIARVLVAAGTPDPTGRQPWPKRDLALAAFLAGTGARASEVCGARICHLVLDVEDPYVRITGKGGTMRDCPLPPEVAAAVQTYLASREERMRLGRGATTWRGLTTMAGRSRRQRSTIWYVAGSPAPACPSPAGRLRTPSGTSSRCS
jgi:site-specific recombinase XerC